MKGTKSAGGGGGGGGQREKREKGGKGIESGRDDRQGESAVGRGGGHKWGLREDSYAYPVTELNNTGDRGEGNSDVDPTIPYTTTTRE